MSPIVTVAGGAAQALKRGRVPALAQLRSFPTREWQFLLGPQSVPGVVPAGLSVTAHANMEEYFTKRVQAFVNDMTEAPGYVATPGTVAVTNGSSTIAYTGTFADSGLTVNGRCAIDDTAAGVRRYFRVQSVDSANGTAVLGGYGSGNAEYPLVAATWPGSTQSGLTLLQPNPSYTVGGSAMTVGNAWGNLNYYDTTHALYQAWAREDGFATDSNYRTLARTLIDHYADSRIFDGFDVPGQNFGFSQTPRTSGLYGAICRMHDGRPEWAPAIDRYLQFQSFSLLDRHVTGGPLGTDYFTPRDGGYVLEFLALLAVVHPDAGQRTFYRDKAISRALDPVLRSDGTNSVQFFGPSDDYVRWLQRLNFDEDDNGVIDRVTSGGDGVVGGGGTAASQPFQDSIVLSALRAVMRMMQYYEMDSGAQWDTIRAGYLAGVRAWKLAYLDGTSLVGHDLARYVGYFSGRDDHYRVGNVSPSVGDAVVQGAPFFAVTGGPASFGVMSTTDGTNVNQTLSARQNNADGLVNLGYAYALTGDATYLDFAREVIESCFETRYVLPPTEGGTNWDTVGGDGRMSLYQASTQKNWNQHYGNGQVMKMLGWMLGASEDW